MKKKAKKAKRKGGGGYVRYETPFKRKVAAKAKKIGRGGVAQCNREFGVTAATITRWIEEYT